MRIPGHTIDDAPDGSAGALADLRRTFGTVLNFHASMADSPVVLNMYAQMNKVLREYGTFSARARAAIALAVAAEDDCGYCQSAHTASARKAGWPLEDTVAIRSGAYSRDAKLVALLSLARQITAHRGQVSEPTWRDAVDAGWTTAEIGEAFGHVMVSVFADYYNHLNHTEPDLPPVPGAG